VIFRNHQISWSVLPIQQGGLVMAFYRPQDLGLIEPRDPSVIDQWHAHGSDASIFSLAILLIVIALIGLSFL
jgi:hypothetical protein